MGFGRGTPCGCPACDYEDKEINQVTDLVRAQRRCALTGGHPQGMPLRKTLWFSLRVIRVDSRIETSHNGGDIPHTLLSSFLVAVTRRLQMTSEK